jgi:hypothetical protein
MPPSWARSFGLAFEGQDAVTVPLLATDAVAADARIFCEGGRRPGDDAGYVIKDRWVGDFEGDPRLFLTVDWTSEEPPMYQACAASFELTDGTQATYDFGMSVGRGQTQVLLTPRFADATILEVSCRPFTGEDGWGQ